MPVNIGPRVGLDCALYYKSTITSPPVATGAVLVLDAVDVNISANHAKIETPSRASKWKSKIPGMTELTLTFGYLWQGDPTDAILTALQAAFFDKTVLQWFVMDNLMAGSTTTGPAGARGICFPGLIFDFPIDQPLEAGSKLEIGVELTRHKIGGNLLDPVWFSVAGS